MAKEYYVMLEAYIDLDDVERIINWSDQGWEPYANDSYNSFGLVLRKEIIVKTNKIDQYVKAINDLGIGKDIRVAYAEEKTE